MSTSSPYAVWYVLRRFSSNGLLRAAPRRDNAKKMHRYSFMATASMLCRRRVLLFQSAGDSSLVTDHTVYSEYVTEEGRLRRRLQSAELPRIMWRERTQRAITPGSHTSARAVTPVVTRYATPPKSIRTCMRGC